ncbi:MULTISPECIES: hypothetical protein [Streptococcus]|uniref:Histone acetyltransferase n=1 Tax=Streptococcus caledonicus TaxID=2614158 RepID=A0ABW0UCZ0_9STRE|nr:hypothetical protein [Streptococcus sp. S784/96/1]
MDYLILELQVSQFYLSQAKVEAVKAWFNPDDLLSFVPVPIKKIGNRVFLTDGHSRAWVAYQAGLKSIPVIWDEDDLDWNFYLACVTACEERHILTVADLTERQLGKKEYEDKWLGFCRKLADELGQ